MELNPKHVNLPFLFKHLSDFFQFYTEYYAFEKNRSASERPCKIFVQFRYDVNLNGRSSPYENGSISVNMSVMRSVTIWLNCSFSTKYQFTSVRLD